MKNKFLTGLGATFLLFALLAVPAYLIEKSFATTPQVQNLTGLDDFEVSHLAALNPKIGNAIQVFDSTGTNAVTLDYPLTVRVGSSNYTGMTVSVPLMAALGDTNLYVFHSGLLVRTNEP